MSIRVQAAGSNISMSLIREVTRLIPPEDATARSPQPQVPVVEREPVMEQQMMEEVEQLEETAVPASLPQLKVSILPT